jgi:hypothetical protein
MLKFALPRRIKAPPLSCRSAPLLMFIVPSATRVSTVVSDASCRSRVYQFNRCRGRRGKVKIRRINRASTLVPSQAAGRRAAGPGPAVKPAGRRNGVALKVEPFRLRDDDVADV